MTDIRQQIAPPDCFQQENESDVATHEAFYFQSWFVPCRGF